MSLAITIQSVVAAGNVEIVGFTAVASGTYTTGSGGDVLDFTGATPGTGFTGPCATIASSRPPLFIHLGSQNAMIKYQYVPTIGTTQANCKVTCISAFNTELGTGTYPSEISGDTIGGVAFFLKGI